MSDEGYEYAIGTVAFELDLLLAADSGREKHTDVEEQGGWILPALERGLRALELGPGAGFGSIRYMGEGKIGRPALQDHQVGAFIGPFPVDDDRLKISCLHGVIRMLAETLAGVLDSLLDPDAVLHALPSPDRVDEAVIVTNWITGSGSLDRLDNEAWREALEWNP